MFKVFSLFSLVTTFWIGLSFNNLSLAQIIPDQTLGSENSKINSIDELHNRVEGGATRGSNLFHSFQEFSIGEGQKVYFANPEGIKNIFSRVTGDNVSEIFGTLGVEGAANLFFINPNGIIFGKNAAINVGGSFLATTAESVKFEDGNTLVIRDRSNEPVLTWAAPIGLNLGSSPGSISVDGLGHTLGLNTNEPTTRLPALSSLTVRPEKTLALIGGNITLNGGVLTASDGHIELGAIASGKVFFDSTLRSFQYHTSTFNNIQLQNESLADTSGFFGGSIHSTSDRLALTSGSGFFVQNENLANQNNNIQINAKSLEILGGSFRPILIFDRGVLETTDSQNVRLGFIDGKIITPGTPISQVLDTYNLSLEEAQSVISFVPSFVFTESLKKANGNNIEVNSKNLLISNGAQLITRSFDDANSGNIKIDKAVKIRVEGASNTPGFTERSFEIYSQINSINFGSGRGGNIDLSANIVNINEGGSINSGNSGIGEGGNVTLNANIVDLKGSIPFVFLPSAIATGAANEGDAGNLTINAKNIFLSDGAAISSTTLAGGNSGKVQVNALNLIKIEGIQSTTKLPSSISSEATLLTPELRKAFYLPPFPTGNAGSLIVSANQIQLSNGGQISVKNFGTGDAGNLRLNSDEIDLNSTGLISASTILGEGGNIFIKGDRVELFDSNITASAGGEGNGGNIDIDTGTILGLNSDITATAVFGNGGNIKISSDGVLGLEERKAITGNQTSDVDASSQFGQQGIVVIDNPQNTIANPQTSTQTQPIEQKQVSVKGDCLTGKGVVKNRIQSNIAPSPEDYLSNILSELTWQPGEEPVRADTIIRTPEGKVFAVNSRQLAQIADDSCLVIENIN